jgi:hypothetical protein
MSEMPKEEIEELMVQLERYVKKHWIVPIERMINAMRAGKTREEIISAGNQSVKDTNDKRGN